MPFHQDANDDVRVFAQIAEAIYQRSLKLPESAAREAFDFVEFLEQRYGNAGDTASRRRTALLRLAEVKLSFGGKPILDRNALRAT